MDDWILKGRYRMGEVIGSGGMAVVYKAVSLDTGATVAVKMLRSEFMEDRDYVRQFRKEMAICIEHHHRNIVDTLEIGEEDGRLFIVMEYVAGQTLKEYIQKHARLAHEEIVDIGVQICDALYYAHCHQLVHRDIKPQNILITDNGIAKVTDFGIARSATLATVTAGSDKVMGSVHYFSPEQARGDYTDQKSDLYSMGIVLYEMATGQLPFTGETPVAVAMKQLSEQPVPPRQVNPYIRRSLEAIILKAMQKKPESRYESAREMVNDLMKSLRDPSGDFVTAPEPEEEAGSDTIRVTKVRGSKTESRPGNEPAQPVKRKGLSAGAVVAVAILSLVLVAMAALAGYALTHRPAETETDLVVPDVVGHNSTEVLQMLADAHVTAVIEQEASDVQPEGFAIRCEPGVGTHVDDSVTVKVFISRGTEKVTVPMLEGHSLEEAEALLKEQGLRVGDVRQSNTMDKPDNQVIQQAPASGSAVERDSVVDLWISHSARAQMEMENYVNSTEEQVLVRLEERGLTLEQITRMESSEPAGTILQQEPAAGTVIYQGDAVRLWISKGTDSTETDEPIDPEVEREIVIEVTEKSSRIVINLMKGGEMETRVDETYEGPNKYSFTIPFDPEYEGKQEIIAYLDGVEVARETRP